jgi:hypothetical protein
MTTDDAFWLGLLAGVPVTLVANMLIVLILFWFLDREEEQ